MHFATLGSGWSEWQRDYRYGALVIELPQVLAAILDPIRERLDPISAGRFGAHITVTPPFVGALTPDQVARVQSVVRQLPPMSLGLGGRPSQFDGSSVVYLPVLNAPAVMTVRQALLATGLFRLDLPHTTDFVPHLTISEFGSAPAALIGTTIPEPRASVFEVQAIAWVVPNEAFRFTVSRTFALSGAAPG